ncbi:hypothetical protein AAG906_000472 [Vitis piasezkii]
MFQPNEEKTFFVTPRGLYCYKVIMPFELKNVGATFQRLMTKIFKLLIRQPVEVYIDDIVRRQVPGIHGYTKGNRSQSKPNQSCHEDIPPKFQKRTTVPHRPLSCVETLYSSFHRQTKVCFPYIKRSQTIGWTIVLTGEELYMYLAISNCVVSAILFRHEKDKERRSIYYVSKAMVDSKYDTPRWNRPFYSSVIVLTNQPLRSIFHKPDLSGRMLKWSKELIEYGIKYQPKLAIKGQVMADFIVEIPQKPSQLAGPIEKGWWILHVDGASRVSGSEENTEAKDKCMDQCLSKEVVLLLVQLQTTSSIAVAPVCNTSETSIGWMHEIETYLQTGDLPEERGRTLAHHAHSQGYYWPTMKQDVEGYVKKCDRPFLACHLRSSIQSRALGHLCNGNGHTTDYFSKWVEVEAYANIKDKDVSKFVWKNIICRIAFRTFCSKLKIKNLYSTPRYPQSNGQAEATNKTLLSTLKKRLKKTKRRWVDELPGVLWTYKMTLGRPTGTTPFAFVYGMDAVIPTEIGMPTARTTIQGQRDEKQELERQLDWVDEVRGNTAHPDDILPTESHCPLQQKSSVTHI